MSAETAQQIANDFEAFLNTWHSAPEVFDDALDAQIHRWYADYLSDYQRKVWPPRVIPYFSPSSANSCPRELYEKLRGAKRDQTETPPHQGRWRRVGTAIGDTIQRDILFAEKHLPGARFAFERNDRGEPMFEDFAKKAHILDHGGYRFALYGTCDGIMRYVTEDGEVLRVGLEIKSKQTSYSATGGYSMREPKADHVKQTVCYSLMYATPAQPVDYYVILYVNAARKAWEMTEDEREKYPDIRAFGIEITDEMKREVLDYFAEICAAVAHEQPPMLDLDRFTFNNYKTACALSLSSEEYDAIKRKVSAVMRSNLSDAKKQAYYSAFEFIKNVREADVQ